MKGFTLIELMAVIIIISVLMVIAVPNIISTVEKNKEKVLEDDLNNLYIAAENYIVINDFDDQLNINDSLFVNVSDLISNQLITKQSIKSDVITEESTVKVTLKEDKTYGYTFYENNINTSGYLQNNLVIHYDGYNVSNNKLIDLKGDNDVSINSWNNNYATLTDKYVSYTTDYTNLTIHCVYNLNSNYVWNTYQDSTSIIGIGTNLYVNGTTYANEKTGIISETIVISNNQLKQYQNGILIRTLDLSSTSSNRINFNGNIYSFMIYENALTESEINEIYEIDKERFNI